ncbi:MAG: hypothetical protein HY049_11415 [Acidobacteria bacterium]|nr:hypothetical protein [Acidobacteriota bacterium]
MRIPCLLILSIALVSAAPAFAADLTFEERVEAQRAIERVYYSHQIGATLRFDQAVPQELLEKKVRTYLKESLALEKFWHTPVTAEMLRTETARIVRSTRMPERLRELFAALDEDPLLIQECLIRPLLVHGLARGFFASDPHLQAASRARAETLRGRIRDGHVDPAAESAGRSVETIVRRSGAEAPESAEAMDDHEMVVGPEEYDRLRRSVPVQVGLAGPVEEDRYTFVVRVVLDDAVDRHRVATFTIPKASWDSWWRRTEAELDESTVQSAATGSVPSLGAASPASPAACPDESWVQNSLSHPPYVTPTTSNQAIVWTGSLVLEFGGSGGDTGARYDPATDTATPMATTFILQLQTRPTGVWTGSRMIVWGGYDGAPYSSVGALYDPLTDSWTPTSTVGAPSPRSHHTAVWTGTRMIIYGGRYAPRFIASLNTGGIYDPQTDTWTGLFAGSYEVPTGRNDHSAIWTGSRMIVWGGRTIPGAPTPSALLNSGFQYDPVTNTGTALATGGAPSVRELHRAVWTGSRMLIWGGDVGGGRYDPATNMWAPISTSNAPQGILGPSAVWTGSVMVAWGGSDGTSSWNTGGRYDPVADSWAPTSLLNAPAARSNHGAVWAGSVMVISSGSSRGRYDPASDLWLPAMPPLTPTARDSHVSVWTGSRMFVWGGYPVTSNPGGLYDPATDTWAQVATLNQPAPRSSATAVWTGTSAVIWGGQVLNSNIGGRYNPISDSWSATTAANAPATRWNHTAVWTGSRMIVWGGWDGTTPMNTGGIYDPVADAWTLSSGANAPPPRQSHYAVWSGSRMIIWGGYGASSGLNNGGRFDPGSNTWSPMSVAGAPSARSEATAIWTGTRMIIWGGGDGTGAFNSGGRYDPVADTWSATSTAAAPTGRARHSAVWTNSAMIVWGGYPGFGGPMNTGGRYVDSTDVWSPTSTVGAPSPRQNHTAVWDGSAMLLWGGSPDPSSPIGSGATYVFDLSNDLDHDGYTACNGECDDSRASVYPGARQICDGLNNNCSDPIWPSVGATESDTDGDGLKLCEGDCDDTNATVYPGARQTCDGVNHDCSDPSWPSTATLTLDSDGDGVMRCAYDCDDSNAQIWATPGEVQNATFTGGSNPVLSWSLPALPGGTSLLYDVLRSDLKSNFTTGAGCFSDMTATSLTTSQAPALGHAYFFLIRAQDNCSSGQGTLGAYSNGTPRPGRSCP